jgi:hypothetical protein
VCRNLQQPLSLDVRAHAHTCTHTHARACVHSQVFISVGAYRITTDSGINHIHKIQGLDKKQWQHLYSSEMTLLPDVNTLLSLLLNGPPSPMFTIFCQMWKAWHTISVSTSDDIRQCPPCSMNNLFSCVVTCPSQWFFHFGEEIVTAWTHIRQVWQMFQYLPSPAAKEILDSVNSTRPCIVMKDGASLPTSVTTFS